MFNNLKENLCIINDTWENHQRSENYRKEPIRKKSLYGKLEKEEVRISEFEDVLK